MNRFDEKAADWDDDPKKVKISHDFVESLTGAVKLDQGMRVLEFGCGTGIAAMELAPQVGSIVAVDTSAGMLGVFEKKIAAAGVSNVQAVNADLLELSPEGRFDLIYSCLVMHHIADYPAMLAHLYMLLNPGGVIAISDLDAEDGQFHSDNAGIEHFGFCRDVFKDALAGAGFTHLADRTAMEIEREKGTYPVFLITGRKPAD